MWFTLGSLGGREKEKFMMFSAMVNKKKERETRNHHVVFSFSDETILGSHFEAEREVVQVFFTLPTYLPTKLEVFFTAASCDLE